MAEFPEISKEQWAMELTPAKHQKGFYVCPFCGSGTGPKGTAAFSFRDHQHGHCFACDFDGDRYDAELKFMGIEPSHATKEEKAEAARRVKARYDFSPSTGSQRPAAPAADPAPVAPSADFSSLLRDCDELLPGSEAEQYLYDRGFTLETITRFSLGYDPSHYFPGRGTFPAVIGAYDKKGRYVFWRAISEKYYDKPKTAEAGEEPVFNVEALYAGGPVFVVESQFCAMSIEQEGGHAVAIGGGGIEKLIKQIKQKPAAGILLLCLDNDEPGRAQSKKLAEKLTEMGVNFLPYNVAGRYKDPNEALQASPDLLRGFITGGHELAELRDQELKEQAIKEEAERQARTGPGMIDSFLQDVQTRMYEPLPTGIRDIDAALDGGFMRQQLVCLGAAPGAGKTALAQWIFEGMAARGIGCIFLNLEMSRNQIIARSLARCAARKGLPISSVKLLRGYNWTDEQRRVITEAAEEYKRTVAPQMIYNPEGLSANLDDILSYLEVETLKKEAAGKEAPCVVLDYLQIIRGNEREDSTELIKRAVRELKDFAIRHNTVVFLIIAHNRQSNASGTITMESGRDTSAIEYSGDTQIGLTFTRCLKGWVDEHGIKHDKSKNPDELSEKERQEITLKIVKSRFGGVGRAVNLRFNGETMTYTQLYNDFTVVKEETPFDDEEWKPIP